MILSVLILATAGHAFSTAITMGVLRLELASMTGVLRHGGKRMQTRKAENNENM